MRMLYREEKRMRLIDADALCMHLSDWQFGSMTDGKHETEYEVINEVINGIEQEPTVDAVPVARCKDCIYYRKVYAGERKRGRWREYPIADGMNQCSECGILCFGESNFCPNCGSDMRGEANEGTVH